MTIIWPVIFHHFVLGNCTIEGSIIPHRALERILTADEEE